jgi:hypothetical protein
MGRSKTMRGSPEEVADIFIRNSVHVTRREFAELVEYALQDNTPREVAAIAAHMPPNLQDLLPHKYLH